MDYKLYDTPTPIYNAEEQVLSNRGIDVNKQQKWLNASIYDINDYRLIDNMVDAVRVVDDAITANEDILVIVDCDCDGYTSSAILMNYIHDVDEEFAAKHLFYNHHSGKQHGFSDIIDEIEQFMFSHSRHGVVISPDGGTNDIEEQNRIAALGWDVVVLDHHLISDERVNDKRDNITIVNIQNDNYPNKALTGAGVVYQFCRAYEDMYDYADADEYLDLAAIGNAGDMADYHEIEIRALMNEGLTKITNPFLFGLAKKNQYILNKRNGMNYLSVAFGIVPFINAITRSGTLEEKDIIFKAMCISTAFEQVPSSKRGEKGKEVPLWQEAVLVADRVKRRQTKLQNEGMAIVEKTIKEQNLLDNAVIVVTCGENDIDPGIVGLVANKLQAKYQRPAIVLRETGEKYSGSGRNYSKSPVEDFKGKVVDTGYGEGYGHAGAFGAFVNAADLNKLIDTLNAEYADVDQTFTYWVDYAWDENNVNKHGNDILELAELNIYGQGIPESLVAVDGIKLDETNVMLMGVEKGHPTIKIQIGDISAIKFGASEEEYEEMISDKTITFIAKPNKNEWNGRVSPQLLIEDYELKDSEQEWVF